MSAHTPGPWNITDDEDNDDETIVIAATDGLTTYYGIADVRNWNKERAGEHKANANLIAAAPEMLQTLRFVLERSGDPVIEQVVSTAIAKAEGK